jgi:hypothetical protein
VSAEPTSSSVDIGGLLSETAINYFVETIKSGMTNFAFKTLDDYLEYLLDKRKDMMAAEMVTLPKFDGMTEVQARRAVTMATLVVLARISHKVLEKADEDFQSIKVDYQSLITQREDAAKLLIETVDQRRAALKSNDSAAQQAAEADLKRSLRQEDLNFIDKELNDMSVADFAKDMAAQNLALEYLRAKDPAKFKDYRTKADEVVRRTSAYVRTVSGVAAFGAMSASFGHSVVAIAQEKQANSVLGNMPLVIDFLRSAAPLAKKSVEVSLYGVTLPLKGGFLDSIFSRRDLFLVEQDNQGKGYSSAANTLEAVQKAGKGEPFVKAFFGGSGGWLSKVQGCDAAEAGQMLDAAVPKEDRTKFATDYFGWSREQDQPKAKEFAFINALSKPGNDKERNLGQALLGTDHRRSTTSLPLAEVQKSIAKNYINWSDRQLLRLIFENSEISARYATLQIEGLQVRPVPTPESIYVYESRAEACRRTADRELGAPPSVPGKGKGKGKTA